jgi:hypothetical protein
VNVTVQDSIRIAAPPEVVWDYTQDWTRRREWDDSVLEAKVVSEEPRVVEARWRGFSAVVRYKLYDRPRRTSLATEGSSWLVSGGGGSWEYVPVESGTEFRQTNTIQLRGLGGLFFGWLVRRQLASATRASLEKARAIIERR